MASAEAPAVAEHLRPPAVIDQGPAGGRLEEARAELVQERLAELGRVDVRRDPPQDPGGGAPAPVDSLDWFRLPSFRISLEVYAFNPRARRAYEKAGFRAEGVLRESLRYGDQRIDATVMPILAGGRPPAAPTRG